MLYTVLTILADFTTWFVAFGVFLLVGMKFGARTLVNIAFALYLSVGMWFLFPSTWADIFIEGNGIFARSIVMTGLFMIAIYSMHRLFPREGESLFDNMKSKILYACACTLLFFVVGVHVIDVGSVLLNSVPLTTLFEGGVYGFLWYFVPLLLLML